ncbi:TetR/AcrR family transcriptional regulator [Lacticaseibacillus thailandensis]|uniref:TetR/AcrR family transcriptional regulator n=1 Tax=Lacticaseibacillus thailandensis TaxID=381741 RepID=UPI0006CF67E7|nr:TetR/AcrR family transcriptional regulator [Lacticaseibacillus thailandensis]
MTDLRTQRTNRLIETAFVDLVNQTGFDHITITQLAHTAHVNRQTLYRHYADKYALAEHLVRQTVVEFDRAISARLQLSANHDHDQQKSLRVVSNLVHTYVAAHTPLLTALMTLRGSSLDFRDRLQRQIEHRYRQYFADVTPDQEDLAIQASLFNALILGTLDFILTHQKNAHRRADVAQYSADQCHPVLKRAMSVKVTA